MRASMLLGPYHVDPEASECVGRDEFNQFKVQTRKQIDFLKKEARKRDYKIQGLEASRSETAEKIEHWMEKTRKCNRRVKGLKILEKNRKIDDWRTRSSSNPYSTDDNRGYSPGSDTACSFVCCAR